MLVAFVEDKPAGGIQTLYLLKLLAWVRSMALTWLPLKSFQEEKADCICFFHSCFPLHVREKRRQHALGLASSTVLQ